MIELDQTRLPFDNQTLNYNTAQHPLPEIVLKAVQVYYPDVVSLDSLHEVIPANKVADTMNRVSNDLLKTDFYDHFDAIVNNQIVPAIGTDVLIQKFGNLRALIPDQDKIGAVLAFHQGRWVGNGLGLRTIWMPFTACFESNSMQIMDLDTSRDLTRQIVREGDWPYEKMEQACADLSWPVTLQPGQAHLFFQEHIHGNIPNRTDKTRVSIDIRILVRDGQPHRKWPGAYFRKLFDRSYTKTVPVLPEEITVTYSEFEGFKTRHLDLYFQTSVVKGYCQRRGIPFPYQHGDNEGLNYAHLDHLITNTKIDHLLLFSIFSMPSDKERRLRLFNTALDKGCRIHFCNEELVLETQNDLDKIEYLTSFTNDWSSPVQQLLDELNLKHLT
jgi:sporadic carbohydrate cluster 2OG-Fe(II) oxygenase/sporadic carbohydrate cluster protein (TIGR04323 family)